MDTDFSIKKNKVYFKGNLLKQISTENFETIKFTNHLNQTRIKCLKDKNGIWFFNQRNNGSVKFLTSDKENFSFINNDYACDATNVYLVAKDGFLIPNSDAASFVVLADSPYFAKDKNQIYALDGTSGLSIYRYAESSSLIGIDWSAYATDKYNLYHYGSVVEIANDQKYINYLNPNFPYKKRKVISAFEANKEYLSKLHPTIIGWWHKNYPFKIDIENITDIGFYKSRNAIFYLEFNMHTSHSIPTLIFKADYSSFKELNQDYGMDNKSVFYKSIPIMGADVKTFKIISNNMSKDKNNFYYKGNIIECDYRSFESIDDKCNFYKDKYSLYYEKEFREGKVGMRYEIIDTLMPIRNSSTATLKVFSSVWAKDNNQVYRYGKIFKKADTRTFEYLNVKSRYDWAKDKNYLFNDSAKIIVKGIDGSTFKALNKYWGKDENNVVFFHTERMQPSIDTKTFNIKDDKGGAIDKNYTYTVTDLGELKRKKRPDVSR